MGSRTVRVQGTLTRWNDSRGFGFISVDAEGRGTPIGVEPLFVHVNEFPRGSDRPHTGERLSFDIGSRSGGRHQAVHVQRAGLPVPPRPRRSRWGSQNAVSYLAILAFATLYFVVDVLRGVPVWVGALFVVASILCVVVYAADKRAAVARRWRVSESTLLALGLLGGWPGSIVAQQLLRHKTRKSSFQAAFWGSVVLNVIAFVVFTAL